MPSGPCGMGPLPDPLCLIKHQTHDDICLIWLLRIGIHDAAERSSKRLPALISRSDRKQFLHVHYPTMQGNYGAITSQVNIDPNSC